MSVFSASDAALEGFQVLRQHWRVVVGWAVFNLVALVAMVAITVIFGVGVGVAEGADKASGAAAMIGGVIGGLVTALIETALIVAVYRLMLRPTDPGFLHLRFGRDEGRFFLVILILACGAAAVGVLAYVFVGLLGFLGVAGQMAAALLVIALGGWLALRIGLAAPISFAERRIDFARSWRMTRGQAWPLLGMWVLNVCLVMLVWLTLWLTVFVLSGLLTGFHGFAPAEGGEALQSHPGRYLLEAIIPVLCMPALLVLSQAPWVAAYRALSADAADA
ncbi:MAG: hypothetical protein JWQ29_108 [Phenylobacterium sp.]|nr:hypothetical protein [Phenylobacterium sp.]